jgi:hypothetical protein
VVTYASAERYPPALRTAPSAVTFSVSGGRSDKPNFARAVVTVFSLCNEALAVVGA